MFVNKAAAYALKAMVSMTKKLKKYKGKEKFHFFSHELAKECNIPHNYLSKVLRQLVRTGILYAATGQKGGYGFRKKPSNILLYKIIQPFIDIDIFQKCFFGIPFCGAFSYKSDNWECPLYTILKKTTLSEIVEKYFSNGKICEIIFGKSLYRQTSRKYAG